MGQEDMKMGSNEIGGYANDGFESGLDFSTSLRPNIDENQYENINPSERLAMMQKERDQLDNVISKNEQPNMVPENLNQQHSLDFSHAQDVNKEKIDPGIRMDFHPSLYNPNSEIKEEEYIPQVQKPRISMIEKNYDVGSEVVTTNESHISDLFTSVKDMFMNISSQHKDFVTREKELRNKERDILMGEFRMIRDEYEQKIKDYENRIVEYDEKIGKDEIKSLKVVYDTKDYNIQNSSYVINLTTPIENINAVQLESIVFGEYIPEKKIKKTSEMNTLIKISKNNNYLKINNNKYEIDTGRHTYDGIVMALMNKGLNIKLDKNIIRIDNVEEFEETELSKILKLNRDISEELFELVYEEENNIPPHFDFYIDSISNEYSFEKIDFYNKGQTFDIKEINKLDKLEKLQISFKSDNGHLLKYLSNHKIILNFYY